MSTAYEDIPHDAWIPVSRLADAELTTRRQVYAAIDAGMPHSRIGQRIRVRRIDWRKWHERYVISGGAA
jgi:hypothetical protein